MTSEDWPMYYGDRVRLSDYAWERLFPREQLLHASERTDVRRVKSIPAPGVVSFSRPLCGKTRWAMTDLVIA